MSVLVLEAGNLALTWACRVKGALDLELKEAFVPRVPYCHSRCRCWWLASLSYLPVKTPSPKTLPLGRGFRNPASAEYKTVMNPSKGW
jgi:hypothetical protein